MFNMTTSCNEIRLPRLLQRLGDLSLSPESALAHDLASGPLTLRRVWPRAADHFAMEYVDSRGRLVPGQWMADQQRLAKRAQAARQVGAGSAASVIGFDEAGIILQLAGADGRLPGLASVLGREGASLVVHRPERRAVVRVDGSAGTRTSYVKVVRPGRTAALASASSALRRLASPAFRTPDVLFLDEDRGVLEMTALSGSTLYDLLKRDKLVQAAVVAGRVLRALHNLEPPAAVSVHDSQREIRVITDWLRRLLFIAPELLPVFEEIAGKVCSRLDAGAVSPVLLHRDFYDKQVLISEVDRPGLIDLDTLAVGDPALDLANALVHFELRYIQGACSLEQASAAQQALVDGYAPSRMVRASLPAYADATRFRLACVYMFRPLGVDHVPILLARIGHSLIPAI